MAEPVVLTCAHCGGAFTRTRGFIASQKKAGYPISYCSAKCAREAIKRRSREYRQCLNCGTEIWMWKSQRGNPRQDRKYCSKLCMDTFRSKAVECAKCGIRFKTFRAVSRKYCSAECAGIARTDLKRPCLNCGKEFRYLPKDALTAKYCCFSCKVVFEGKSRRKGQSEVSGRCSSANWRELRSKIIERDGGKCTRCGTPEYLTVHHIVKWRVCRDDSPENLTTLCRSCHMLVEFGGVVPVPVPKRFSYGR